MVAGQMRPLHHGSICVDAFFLLKTTRPALD
jgi:hypothetical protein